MTDQPDMQQSDHPEHNMPPTTSFTDERNALGDAAMNSLPPRSGSGFTQERNDRGDAAMSKLPPRSYKSQ